ncbi:MAG: class I SAM-dependent methyltransferase [Oscillospiraceae bacterium]
MAVADLFENMLEYKLTKRLKCAADAVRDGARVADVGCDHGKLCAYLVISKKSSFTVAIDVNEQPLESARSLFAQLKIEEKTRCVLCDGLDKVCADDVDDIVMAGIGYYTIAEIVRRVPWLAQPTKRLVLVPASDHDKLRRFLYSAGYEIKRESAVCEKGQFYTVMTAAYSGIKCTVSPHFAAFGKIHPDGDGLLYWRHEYEKAKKILKAIEQRDAKTAHEMRDIIDFAKEYCDDKPT